MHKDQSVKPGQAIAVKAKKYLMASLVVVILVCGYMFVLAVIPKDVDSDDLLESTHLVMPRDMTTLFHYTDAASVPFKLALDTGNEYVKVRFPRDKLEEFLRRNEALFGPYSKTERYVSSGEVQCEEWKPERTQNFLSARYISPSDWRVCLLLDLDCQDSVTAYIVKRVAM